MEVINFVLCLSTFLYNCDSTSSNRRGRRESGISSNTGPSPEFSSREATFLKYSIGCVQQPAGQTWNGGGTDFKWRGGTGSTGPPAGDGPAVTPYTVYISALKDLICQVFLKTNTFSLSQTWDTADKTIAGGPVRCKSSQERKQVSIHMFAWNWFDCDDFHNRDGLTMRPSHGFTFSLKEVLLFKTRKNCFSCSDRKQGFFLHG